MVFEDGEQRRDFVHVEDVARAFLLALEHPDAPVGGVFNIASGEDRSVRDVAALLARAMGREAIAPEITGKARAGDIRHCIADIGKARAALGYRPERDFSHGLVELAEWVARQQAEDRVNEARRELESRGLVA
jgi:dTDP-L-rhamnose 4-epimerase